MFSVSFLSSYTDVYSLLVNLDPQIYWSWHSQQIFESWCFSSSLHLCNFLKYFIEECQFPDILKFAEVSAENQN